MRFGRFSAGVAVSILLLAMLLAGFGLAQYNESPMLADRVATGELPAVAERLPVNPVVLDIPGREIGQYGGTWRRAQVGEIGWVWRLANFEAFAIWDERQETYVNELLESYEFNDDLTELTVHLHEGTKWSDGAPYTVDDYIFWWEEVVNGLDPNGNASPWTYMIQPWTNFGGETMQLEKIDDNTMRYHFAIPHPTAPLWWQTAPHFGLEVWPAHYIKTIHPNYNTEVEGWRLMSQQLREIGIYNPEMPTLSPFMPVEYIPGEHLIAERNPYFWKVDAEGNQLPYIDRVRIDFVTDVETLKLKLVTGEVDFQIREELTAADYPLLAAGQERGDYTMRLFHTGRGAQPALYPNLNHSDDTLRRFFRNQNVRIALSIGIDRVTINELIYNGLLQPISATFGADSWHFKAVPNGQEILEEWQQTYAEYDPERANRLLDEAGYLRGSDGRRLFPDGTPIEFVVSINSIDQNKRYLDVAQLIRETWTGLGIRAIMDDMSNDEWRQQVFTIQDYDMFMFESSDLDNFAWPAALFPGVGGRWEPEVTRWYKSNGARGLSPEHYSEMGEGDYERRLLDLFTRMLSETDELKRHEIVIEGVRIHIDDGPFMIGVVGEPTIPGIIKNNFRNVGEFAITGPHWMNSPRNMYPELFFFATEE